MANFLPHKILAGARLLARYIQKNFEAIEAKWPIRAADILSFYMERAIWGRARVPTSALNLDEIFSSSTDGLAALGTVDVRRGMRLVYLSPTTFSVQPGHVMHRGLLKVNTVTDCDDAGTCGTALTPGALLIPGECQDTEGNPSGLDYGGDGLWYYVYAKLDVGGTSPEFRVSLIEPIRCEGKGWEHPSFNKLKYLGCLRTLPSGELRPWSTTDHGWTYWMQAAVASDDQSAGYLREGRNGLKPTGGWVRYEEAVTDDPYHHGPKHIPPTAEAIRVAEVVGATRRIRSSGDRWMVSSIAGSPPAGRSVSSSPAMPMAAASRISRSTPYCSTGFRYENNTTGVRRSASAMSSSVL